LPKHTAPGPEQKVLTYIQKKNLVSSGEKLVVAVSGGPDSVCLLYILAGLRQELGIELHIAHLNHQLRGAESDVDADYVVGLARRLKIPATIESHDVRAYRAQHHLTLEEAAREVRYGFLAEVAEQTGAVKIAVGHTADDHAETVLMHVLRGSGTRGLRGLLPVSCRQSTGGSLTLIRPLLELNRQDTVAYCREHHLQPRTDTSNLSTEPLRNRVRLELLPELREYNPQIKESLLRLARTSAGDMDYIEKEAGRFTGKVTKSSPGSVVFDKKSFLALHPTLQRQLLRSSIESLLGNLKDIEADHIENVLAALDKSAGKVIGLPFGLSFTIEYDKFVLAADSVALCPFPALEGETEFKIPGETTFPGWDVTASILSLDAVKIKQTETDGFTACFDFDRTGDKLTLRHRLPGDRFQPLGMIQPKKLNIFMIDARIPQTWRRRIPIVCAGEQILWVVGYRIDERVKVRPDTVKVLRLEFKHTSTVIPS
jgi:tRNA(Ile)-lysidine synthase